ncbi:hypothetical protein SEMRO_141_G065830.1 [Seminavis robusta]|uniref:Uncharacterized protein n=1 Tax=Seminavis robusta TaxID=568900 RepID=A0A9N8DG44_9STRA|nr:hypothetical protein SEMRO_141_G065830.1 [Seminavis robusta]|eukprot:Sro141_g065830.1 n/a (189) ;mRNA; r:54333-55066
MPQRPQRRQRRTMDDFSIMASPKIESTIHIWTERGCDWKRYHTEILPWRSIAMTYQYTKNTLVTLSTTAYEVIPTNKSQEHHGFLLRVGIGGIDPNTFPWLWIGIDPVADPILKWCVDFQSQCQRKLPCQTLLLAGGGPYIQRHQGRATRGTYGVTTNLPLIHDEDDNNTKSSESVAVPKTPQSYRKD